VRPLFVLLVVFAGCVATFPSDPSISADLAVEMARAKVELSKIVPPDNTPNPDGKCSNCDGRGYVGDGTVKVKCQPCDGTGKLPKSVCVNCKAPK
jgi:hypothetical protein